MAYKAGIIAGFLILLLLLKNIPANCSDIGICIVTTTNN
jgi:hypothetical protein